MYFDRFKNFQFDRVTAARKVCAEKYLHANFMENWCVQIEVECKTPKPVKKRRSIGLVGALLDMDVDEESTDDDGEDDEVIDEMAWFQGYGMPSEVDRYLQMPQVSHTDDGKDVDILVWWKLQARSFPCLSKMARQYLSLPCSSAGKVDFHIDG